MNVLDQFSIPVSGLSNGLHGYEFSIDKDFFDAFEESPIEEGSVQVHFDFDKREDMYVLLFSFEGEVQVTCDRCLDPFSLPIEDRQSLLVKFDDEPWEDADVVFIQKGTQMLNVAKYIYEFINLAVPMTKTHDDAGEDCNPDMLKYLEQPEEEEAEEPNPNPFLDALKDFNIEN
ncbi:MAG: DUF177 domain-containing protein [Saprospiraceae bacterium]|jgi:uncharacterized metal-binding protein YceD (DUF177 family)